VVEAKGVKVGLLSYSLTFPETFWATPSRPGTAHGERSWVEADVKTARPKVDILLVSFHWGQELMTEPKSYQVDLGRAARWCPRSCGKLKWRILPVG
jgi:poly-gamma-glutamate synthesis protein (capsule biosynthesis protein)